MKWFYNLKSSIRILITVLSYLPFIILANIVGGSLEGHSNFLYAIAFIFLAFPIVITVFAVKANKKEKTEKQAKILKEMEAAAERKKEEEKEKSLAKKLSLIADKKCPACGGTIGYNEKTDTYACDFCGTPINPYSENNQSNDTKKTSKNSDKFDYIDLPINTKVVGVTYENRQEHIKDSEEGDDIIIKHTPSTKYPEATSVINKRTNKMLGHIKAELAERMVEQFGEYFILLGEITDITGDENLTYGCNIVIYNEE